MNSIKQYDQMDNLRIALFQMDVVWGNVAKNLSNVKQQLLSLKDNCDIVVLPEMFSTGFTTNISLAEPISGSTICSLINWSKETSIVVVGSFFCIDDNNYFNRGFIITPDTEYFYDKRHLFRMSDEAMILSKGNQQLIIGYKGWNISLQICYDLRFPVWCRNDHQQFDLQIFVACWPSSRNEAWKTLLKARAIENQVYVAGLNQVGKDKNGIDYDGNSLLIDTNGTILANALNKQNTLIIYTLEKKDLIKARKKFPVWMDADSFTILKE